MKRFLPLILIVAVALVTASAGALLYRAKMKAAATAAAAAKAKAPAEPPAEPAEEDGSFHARGPATAPVTLEIYGDFQCPACATTSAVIDDLEKEYEGKLRVVFHEFPLAMHPHAVPAAMAAEAAGQQGQFWEMHDMLYRYQQVWSKASNPGHFFSAYAQQLGLDPVRFAAESRSEDLKERLMKAGNAGVARGVKNTPTVFVNGVQVLSSFKSGALRAAINDALAAKGKS